MSDEPRRRGELRIYLGAAPGVGKTYAMLSEARRRRERGTDVVIGVAETHGRDRVAELLHGLEFVPARRVERQGTEYAELDVDAVLAREPDVAVIDELAHTNVPGSRHEKRYQDVEELLEAGITVLTTLNVQQLRSLGDVVERITGAREPDTVPDPIVRNAEQVELVDITPEALRRRLAHGHIYPAERVDAALSDYFRVGNLTALRELALLWVADQVDIALQRYRAEKSITDTWETRERIVAAVTGGPESETLIRRARRAATKAGGDLLVLHVLRDDDLAESGPGSIGRCRKLAEDIGATFHTVVGRDVPSALLDFARGVNATQLVLGTSRRSRLARLFNEGIGAAVVRRSGPIDVHMVTHEQAGGRFRTTIGRSPLAPSRHVTGWLLAPALPAAATVAGVLLRPDLDFATNVVCYFLATVLVALVGGLGPGLAAALIGTALLNFYFTVPHYTLMVSSPRVVVALVGMLITAVLVALVVGAAARRATLAARAQTEAALLGSFARIVLTHPAPLERLVREVRENFGQTSASLLERQHGRWRRVAESGSDPCDDPAGADTDIPVTPDVHLTLRGRTLPASDRGTLETAAGQALLALRQQRMAAATAEAERKAEATELRTALLSAVGHDLRSPLTSIKASIASLRAHDIELSAEDTEDLLETIDISVDRLASLVDNLLDSSRLATGAVTPHLRPVGCDEVVAQSLSSMDKPAAAIVDVKDDLPWVLADPGLLERVVANVIDNALRHGRGPEPIAIRASAHSGRVDLRITDHGPGLPAHVTNSAFAPFQRIGDRDSTPGVGLGLSVAKGFTEAMGGTIRPEDTPGGGLTMVISLPIANGASG